MKYIKTALLFTNLLFLQVFFSFGQNIFPTKFNSCNDRKFTLDGEISYMDCNVELISRNLTSTVEKELLIKTRGEIKIQVLIDTLGNSCIQSLENNLNKVGKKINFRKAIVSPGIYTIPIRDGNKIFVSTIIKIVFKERTINFYRLGYTSKTGYIVKNSFIYHKEN